MNSSESSRKKILNLLQQKNGFIQKDFINTLHGHKSFDEDKRWSVKEKILRLKSMMEGVNTEVHLCERETWKNTILAVLEQKNVRVVSYADWKILDEYEVGQARTGAPREKEITVASMLGVMDGS